MKKLIFVYGTLKKGFSNHRVMGESTLLGEATITGFDMLSLGGFPALVKGKSEIKGEVYEVNQENTLRGIYRLEGYTGNRNSTGNWYETADVDTPFGEAELFYMKDGSRYNDRPIIQDGVWRR